MYGFFFDPVTAALLIDPSIVTTQRMGVRVEAAGKTQEDADGTFIDVGLGLDFDRFQKILLDSITS
jgi:inosine-uridine nucleoside N-ribohydrolase